MNKIVFLIPVFFLAACASQVTVTPEVTVTLPPPPTLTVTPTLTATATEVPRTATPEVLTPEQQLTIDTTRFGITQEMISGPDAKYTLGYDKDNKITLTDKKGVVTYKDGKWNSDKIVEIVAATQNCYPSPYPKAPGFMGVAKDDEKKWGDGYIQPMIDRAINMSFWADHGVYPNAPVGPIWFLPGTDNCWSTWITQNNGRVDFIWFDINRKLQNVEVFDPKKK